MTSDFSGWFPTGRNLQPGWRLDIVSLLAVIGESAMVEHAQTLTSSWLCMLPRLIPAPQGLLKSERPKRLPPVPGVTVVGAFSGTKVEELNFAANLIHEVAELRPLEFQEYTITYRYDDRGRTQTRIENDKDPERDASASRRGRDKALNKQGKHETDVRLQARLESPLNVVTIFSCLLTIGLFIWALFITDGVAACSISCMALTSICTGCAMRWEPVLAKRHSQSIAPRGDVVIKTRGGAFVVVHCDEEIARELYTGTDLVKYMAGNRLSKALVGLGTVTLMVGVVLLGNCNWAMQAIIGVTYLILNGLYWIVSLLPPQWSWHIKAYKVELHKRLPDHMLRAHERADMNDEDEPPSFTRTLWYAIQRSRSEKWIDICDAAPRTDAWKEWIKLALDNVDNVNWPAIQEKNRIMAKYELMRREGPDFDPRTHHVSARDFDPKSRISARATTVP